MTEHCYCGIDVANLDVQVLPHRQRFSVDNNATGWAELVERLACFADRRSRDRAERRLRARRPPPTRLLAPHLNVEVPRAKNRSRLVHNFLWCRGRSVTDCNRSIEGRAQASALVLKCSRPRKAVAVLVCPNSVSVQIGKLPVMRPPIEPLSQFGVEPLAFLGTNDGRPASGQSTHDFPGG